jgi:malignant T-cell-amplified sequence
VLQHFSSFIACILRPCRHYYFACVFDRSTDRDCVLGVMFKKFSPDESVSGQAPMKSSQQRAIRTRLVDEMPRIEPYIDDMLPKKDKAILAKCTGHINVIADLSATPLFFQIRDAPYLPTLRTLHKYPFLLPILRVDRGAIKHVMNGADVMVPGLRSERAIIEDEVARGTPVAVYAESKEHAIAIGICKMSTDQMRINDKGVAIETIHHLNDGLWRCTQLF